MVPSWWPLLLLPHLLGLVSSKSGGKISLSQSWEKTLFQYEFSIDSLGPTSKRELELFNLSFSTSCPFDWVQRRLSHSSNYRWGSTVNWNISQHSKSDDCNIAQVLIYGCWTTSSELSGLSQADKVSLLQGVLKTQVQEVKMLLPWTFPTGRFLHRSYSCNSHGLTVQKVFFRVRSSNTQFVLKKILLQKNEPQL